MFTFKKTGNKLPCHPHSSHLCRLVPEGPRAYTSLQENTLFVIHPLPKTSIIGLFSLNNINNVNEKC